MTRIVKHRAGLADFLKTRRARLHPEQFGLPLLGRRRTVGLRREELAQLVGVGLSWYTWLEQGRDIQVSEQVLERLARILQLDEEERSHLFALARGPRPASNEQGREWRDESETYQTILDALGTYPAQLLDRYLNMVAWNESVNRVMGDVESRSLRERNIVWFLLMHPSARARLRDWECAARQGVALLRARSDRYADSAWLMELVADLLHVSPEFRAWWPQHDIHLECNSLSEINHPHAGHLVLQPTTLVVPSRPDLQIVVYTPLSQADTAAKLAVLMT